MGLIFKGILDLTKYIFPNEDSDISDVRIDVDIMRLEPVRPNKRKILS